jgi:hypothetical protein
MLYLI